MLRHLYRVAIRFHPTAFRTRFGDEMLSIFDATQGNSARFGLLCDGLVSTIRQWTMRPDFQADNSSGLGFPAADGVPSFSSLNGFHPRTSAVIDGVILSATLFVVTCFSIRYSWIRVLHVQIPEYQANSYLGIRHSSPDELRGKHTPKPQQTQNADRQSGLISEHLKVDVLPVEAGTAPSPMGVTRATTENAPNPPQIVASDMAFPSPLATYAGVYKSRSPKMTIRIAVKDDQLSMHMVGEAPQTLSRISETEFEIAGSVITRIEFLPAQNGEIVRLRLSRDGQQITAERQ